MNSETDYRKHQSFQPGQLQQIPVGMDYTSYFAPGPVAQPYQQYMGLPPTPVHTQTATSDEYHDESPHSAFDFQFDAYGNYNPTVINPPQPPTPQSQKANSLPPTSHDGLSIQEDYGQVGLEGMNDDQKGSNSDDGEETAPTLSRRKAQNRAAQRAFRERKERHVKDLEAQVASLKAASNNTNAENEKLKLTLQKLATENEILKATSHLQQRGQQSPPSLPDTGPMHFKPKDFYTNVLHEHDNKYPSHRIVTDPGTGGRLLGAGATWDFILAHELYKKGLVDVAAVSEKLKTKAKCDGQGPVFDERTILMAIESSVASGSDELI